MHQMPMVFVFTIEQSCEISAQLQMFKPDPYWILFPILASKNNKKQTNAHQNTHPHKLIHAERLTGGITYCDI